MRPTSDKHPDHELELPALDGDEDADAPAAEGAASEGFDLDDVATREPGGDPFDDRTGEDAPHDDIAAGTAEGGWLADADGAADLDIGPVDVAIAAEGRVLGEDEGEAEAAAGLEELIGAEEAYVADSGEEGPLAGDEELREEDLPALDADEDGDVPDDDLFDRSLIGGGEDLRWDDRAWTRATVLADAADEADDSGVLPVPGDDPTFAARDAAWRTLDATGRVLGAAFLPGGSVVIALATLDRSRAQLVRVQQDGEARIIAEVEPRGPKADDEECVVTFLRWDGARRALVVGGNFGVEHYQPTL